MPMYGPEIIKKRRTQMTTRTTYSMRREHGHTQ